MKCLLSCEFNFDTVCVELKFSDGTMIAIDTIAVENEVADNMYQRSELDYLTGLRNPSAFAFESCVVSDGKRKLGNVQWQLVFS